jgi:hypothetical protein
MSIWACHMSAVVSVSEPRSVVAAELTRVLTCPRRSMDAAISAWQSCA